MKNMILRHLPNTAMIMTACLLFTSVINIIFSPGTVFRAAFIIQVFLFSFSTQIFFELLDHIPFKSGGVYFTCFYATVFCFFLLSSYCMSWFPFTRQSLIWESARFALLCAFLHLYFSYLGKKRADEINRLINMK